MNNNTYKHIDNMIFMELLTLLFVTIVSSASIDLVYDEGELVDGIVYNNNIEPFYFDSVEKIRDSSYFGQTSNGDNYYLIITDGLFKLKVWADNIRLIEQYQ